MRQKKSFDRRHSAKLPSLAVGDQVLVQKGNSKQFRSITGPFRVTDMKNVSGIPKRVTYEDRGVKVAALRNIVKFCPRRDSSFEGEGSDI